MLIALALLAATGAPTLAWPVACTPNVDCVIQSYRDDDPGPKVADYQCHGRSYPGHDGTDIRIPSLAAMRAGVQVRAAAPGRVLRARDGLRDVSVRDQPLGTPDTECGNGLVIDHGGGWETQYCHMKQGSIAVRPGQSVAAGTPLGQVGLSGDTEFPHLHLTVRKDGKSLDPFAFSAAPGSCGGGRSLWAKTPAYLRGQVLAAGFATGPVTMAQAQATGADQLPRPTREAPALVAFIQSVGLVAGDRQRLRLTGPDGATLADNAAPPLDRDKAQTILFAGRKRPPSGWMTGPYTLDYTVIRAGKPVLSRRERIAL